MAGPRQPIQVVQANGRKHLTKDEIRRRTEEEVQPCTDDIEAPGYLSSSQKKQFNKIAAQLLKIKIMGETDVDALARYITAQSLYEAAVKELRKLTKDRPKDKDDEGYFKDLEVWSALMDLADKRQDRYFKQAQSAARDLGLTISSRCRLQVPVTDEKPRANKFSRFDTKAVGR